MQILSARCLLLLPLRGFTLINLVRGLMESEHSPLEIIHLKNLTAAPPRLQRMLLRIQGYDLTVKYKPGAAMLLADPLILSRLNLLPSEG